METNIKEETKKTNLFLISDKKSLLYGYVTDNIYIDLYQGENRSQRDGSSGCSGSGSHCGMKKHRISHEPDGKRIILSRRAKHRRKP